MRFRRLLAAGAGLSVLAPLALPSGVGALPAPDPVVTGAAAWLLTQQQADASFEVAQFPGFETSDVIFALAAAGNVGPSWSFTRAESVIEDASVDERTPLDAIDELIDGVADPTTIAASARAAKVVALAVQPLGLDPTDFDPSGDSDDDVDLLARIDQRLQGDGTYAFGAQFNGLLYTAIALGRQNGSVSGPVVGQIRDAQRADGSWDFTGTTTGDGDDIDTTALALIALRSAGLTLSDADVAAGVAFLAGRQRPSGAWQAFGGDDPNSTSLAAMALADLRIDVTTSGWRAAAGSPATGAYVSPLAWLRSQQVSGGRIASQNDGFGVNTLATSQSVQALARQWFLTGERSSALERWSERLASPALSPDPNKVAGAGGSDALGANPSVRSARLAAATAMVNSQDGREAAAADLFQAAFGRTLDPGGRAFWSNQLRTLSRPEVLARLTGTSEYYRRAGGTVPAFVDAVYQSVLGRGADPSGRAFWIGRLQSGVSVQSVARSLTGSAEYRRLQVRTAYARVLERPPTSDELAFWTNRVATARIETLLATLGGSAEFYASVDAVGGAG